MQAATDHTAYADAPHLHQPPAPATPPATRFSPQGLCPCTGKGARAGAGAALRHTAYCGPRPGPPPPPPAPPQQPHMTRPPPTTTGQRKGGYPVVMMMSFICSCRNKKYILLSATGPSTTPCSKDVTTHQHRPGARPGLPCPHPVPACSRQPLPNDDDDAF